MQPENQKDYTIRMKEYFDTYLMGAPAPEWLKNGIPRLRMQEHLKSRQRKWLREEGSNSQRLRLLASEKGPLYGGLIAGEGLEPSTFGL